jgi:hypothetical protein
MGEGERGEGGDRKRQRGVGEGRKGEGSGGERRGCVSVFSGSKVDKVKVKYLGFL